MRCTNTRHPRYGRKGPRTQNPGPSVYTKLVNGDNGYWTNFSICIPHVSKCGTSGSVFLSTSSRICLRQITPIVHLATMREAMDKGYCSCAVAYRPRWYSCLRQMVGRANDDLLPKRVLRPRNYNQGRSTSLSCEYLSSFGEIVMRPKLEKGRTQAVAGQNDT